MDGIVMLTDYIASAPVGYVKRDGQLVPSGNHTVTITTAQRDLIVNALRAYQPR